MDPDDVVERWHNSDDDAPPFLEFMTEELGWTEDQVTHWIETAEEPQR